MKIKVFFALHRPCSEGGGAEGEDHQPLAGPEELPQVNDLYVIRGAINQECESLHKI